MALPTTDEIRGYLESLKGLKAQEGVLAETYEVQSLGRGVVLIGEIAQLAGAANHQPDLKQYGYRRLSAALSTHSEGGVTMKDIRLAGQIEDIPKKLKIEEGPCQRKGFALVGIPAQALL